MAYNTIQFTIEDSVAEIRLNRPDVYNSFNFEMAEEVQAAFTQIRESDAIRAVLFTGGGKAFCAGQDLAALGYTAGEQKKSSENVKLTDIVEKVYNPIVRAITGLSKPVVCAVNGVAAGAGANIAFACDIVVASEKARFLQAFSAVGLVPDSGASYFLPRLVGRNRALALLLLGDPMSAADALDLGLVYKVYPPEELHSEARAIATRLAQGPTQSYAFTKKLVHLSWTNSLDQQLDAEAIAQGHVGKSQDHREGVLAFLEKRPARFTGK